MKVFLNGRIVDEAEAVVSVFDRSFLYGDGLFETVRVYNGKPFHWQPHLDRLLQGADTLGIKVPLASQEIAQGLAALIKANAMPDSILRITLSRGMGRRGYSPRDAGPSMLFMTLHPPPRVAADSPARWRLITSSIHLPMANPIAHHKTANRLLQVLARAEADKLGADDALMLNNEGMVCETSSANVFWIESETLRTPAVDTGLLPGVTRAAVIELAGKLGLTVLEARERPDRLAAAEGAFLTLSSLGIVEIVGLDGQDVRRSPLTRRLSREYIHQLHSATA